MEKEIQHAKVDNTILLAEAFKLLERYCDVLPNGQFHWQFASHS